MMPNKLNENFRLRCRVHENLPLYDILNQFQQGHSHMAVVIKSHKEVREPAGFVFVLIFFVFMI